MAVTEQRERNAAKAKKKVDQRREDASGAAGWVAERAGEWSLIALSAPWGIGPAMLLELPLPTKIRTAFQDPVEVDHDPERAGDEAYVDEKYEEVRRSIQGGMDALARRRTFPIFG